MNKPRISGLVTMALALVFAGSASAQLQLIHGNAAEPQYPPAWVQVEHMPQGLDGYIQPNQTTVVNFPLAVDVMSWKSFTKVMVRFYAAPDVHVTGFELWDGGTMIKSKTGSWTGEITVAIKPPYQYKIQYGLNLSVTVAAGSDSTVMHRRFILNGGGAIFQFLADDMLPE